MYLKKIELCHFRNFNKTTIKFHDGINIIVGPNNSGKSNLLYAVNMLNAVGSSNVHDFNKNDISKNLDKYKLEPPRINITYYIEHSLKLDNFDDGILRVKNFIVYSDKGKVVTNKDKEYIISAVIDLRFELDAKFISEYKMIMQKISNANEFMIAMEKMIQYYTWNYYNTTN